MENRRVKEGDGLVNQDPMSSGLLLGMIRSLTSTLSNDQRELERSRLQKGYEDSGYVIDRLLKEHHSDVSHCLNTFRKVSNGITSCRERIHNVKNALHTTKSLLQCRRDDLKKLWVESAEQNYLSTILQQIHEIKHMDQTIEESVKKAKYREAVDTLKRADILLNGPLSQIDGLNQLRTNISDTSQNLFEQIVNDLLQCLVVGPFEFPILNLMKGLNDSVLRESSVCSTLIDKYSGGGKHHSDVLTSSILLSMLQNNQVSIRGDDEIDNSNSLSVQITDEWATNKIIESLEALKVFDQFDSALENIFLRMTSLCIKSVNNTIEVMQLHIRDSIADSSHLAQLTQIMIQQLSSSGARFKIFCEEFVRIRAGYLKALADQKLIRFWDLLQSVLENVISDHLNIWRSMGEKMKNSNNSNGSTAETVHGRKSLFSFENTSFSSTANTSLLKKKQLKLICAASPYNITAIFHVLNRFSLDIEKQLPVGGEPCKLKTFLHSFVMDTFIERIKTDMEQKTDHALGCPDVWSSLSAIPSHNVKILTSCIRIFELCEQINTFIKNMGSYTQRFASLWVLIIAHYMKRAREMYSKIIRTRSPQGDNFVEHQKISAAWAVDEDISRLLKSLPNWTSEWSPIGANGEQTPLTVVGSMNLNESEQEIRHRTQRESEILIGNLGTQKQIKQEELITDMDHLRSLVCMYESLQWFVSNMRLMIINLPALAQEIIKCRIQITNVNGQFVEQLLCDALKEQLSTLDDMAEKCLLMLHLEIRVHCFYHLLPLARAKGSTLPQDEQDQEVKEFGRDLEQYYHTLSKYIVPNKLKYLFDGLGHLCASIFIHSSQYMTKLPESDRKRVCRNIFAVQKHLSKLSGRPETELSRALTFFKLVTMDFDQIFAYVKETGETYSYIEYTYLFSLAVRSHPILSSQPGALESILKQLRENSAQLNIC